jgi:hypothetical protein
MDVVKENETWILNDSSISYKRIMIFNKDGNIATVKDSIPIGDGEWVIYNTVYNTKNKLKTSFKRFDNYNNIIETGEYIWLSKRKYQLISETDEGVSLKTVYKLNAKFRDLKSTSTQMVGDSIISNVSYNNKLLKGSEITHSEIIDHISKKSSITIFSDKEKDSFGNIIKGAAINETENKLINYLSRTIKYYKK